LSEVAKSKRGRKPRLVHEENAWFECDGTINIEETQAVRQERMEERGEEPVAYAPCPNPDAKWKALLAVCTMPGWNGTMKGVMACLIECANYYSGKCCPSEEWMAKQLGRDPSTVKRAVARLKSKYLDVVHRNEPTSGDWKCNAYIVGWTALINRCHKVFPWTDRKHRGAILHDKGGNVAQNRGAEVTRKDIELEDIEGRYEPKRVRPPSVADTNVIPLPEGKKEEGIQRGEVESAATNSQTSECSTYDQACNIVSRYCEPFHWTYLKQEDFDAAVAAELGESGAGRAVVNELASQRAKEEAADG
jgi:hypothetical protein